MSDTLHQINVQYSNVEDRILLRASTENDDEYLFWLTRRFTRLLLGILGREIEQRGGAATLGAQKETKRLFSEGAFERPYAENAPKKRPLGAGLLAFSIKTGAAGDGNLILEIQSEAGQGIVFNLNDTLLYMFYSLLTQGVTQTEWQLDPFPEGARKQLH